MAFSNTEAPSSREKVALADEVRTALPGWVLVDEAGTEGPIDRPAPHAEAAIDVDALRKKFLGTGSTPAGEPIRTLTPGSDSSVGVFKVRPASGGPAQIAERRNGRIRIVSG